MAVPAATNYPVHELGFNAAANAFQGLGLDNENRIDIEITVYAGFDEESEKLISEAREAAYILSRDYGYIAVVVPVTVSWNITSLMGTNEELPALVINGYKVDKSRVSSPEDIVDAALALLYESGEAGIDIHIPRSNPSDFLNAAVEEV